MSLLLVLHLLLLTSEVFGQSVISADYRRIRGFNCVRDNFVRVDESRRTEKSCAFFCLEVTDCVAFTMTDGVCRIFVFNRCSKNVRDCNCNSKADIFVKRLTGLSDGSLCPDGYGYNLCGVKYRLYSVIQYWQPNRAKCAGELGLVIMADVENSDEMQHVNSIKSSTGVTNFFLGGQQAAGSVGIHDGWSWLDCGLTVNDTLWGDGEPGGSPENSIGTYLENDGLNDFRETSGTPKGVLCECVSPFD